MYKLVLQLLSLRELASRWKSSYTVIMFEVRAVAWCARGSCFRFAGVQNRAQPMLSHVVDIGEDFQREMFQHVYTSKSGLVLARVRVRGMPSLLDVGIFT